MSLFSKYRDQTCHFLTLAKLCLILIAFIIAPTSSYAASITSAQSGDWDNVATWVGGVIPVNTDDATIASYHKVTLQVDETINNLIIESGATLEDNNRQMTINGNFTLNGTFNGKKALVLNGVETWIDGIGNKTNMGGVTISSGNKTILSSANLNFTKGNFTIGNGLTVTNNGVVTFKDRLKGGDPSSTWINAANSTLNIGREVMATGVLNASAIGNTVRYWRNNNQVVKRPSSGLYYNLNLAGLGNKTLEGATTVLGDVIISSTLDVVAGSDWSLSVGGNWTNSGGFEEQNGTVTFDGVGTQTITSNNGETFYNLTVNKGGGNLVMSQNDTVRNLLSMPISNSGNIDASSGSLTLGTSCLSEGALAHSSGAILGQFRRWINFTSPTNYQFPVGVSTDSRPALLTINALGNCGTVVTEFIMSSPGSNGLPIEDGLALPDSVHNTYVEGYWTLAAENGLSTSDYNLELTGNGMTSFTPNASTRLLTRTGTGNPWMGEGTHVAAVGNTIRRVNITFLPSEHAFGDTINCTAPVAGVISGDNAVCSNDAGVTYSIASPPSSTYTWTIIGGSQASGGATDTITVNWGATGMVGNVSVVENNGCTDGPPINFAVAIHTIVPTSILGKTNIAQNTTGESYSVTAMPGYTYNWSISGSTSDPNPAFGQGTDSITVDWGPAGSGNVSVVADNGSCDPTSSFGQAISIYQVIETIAVGNWNDPSIWNCGGCVPGDFDNIRIIEFTMVTLTGNEKINNVIIESNGILFDNGKRLDIAGDLTINGTYTGSGQLKIKGSGNTLDGSAAGSINTSGTVRLEGGSTIIASTAVLTISPGTVELRSGHTVTNNGSLIIGGDLVGQDATVTWINAANSSLTLSGVLLANGTLTATAMDNTVEYNGSASQTIKPVDYYNVSSTGAATNTLTANMLAAGDVYISAVNGLNASVFDIEVRGNWTNDGGTFTPGTGTVTFNGAGTQTITHVTSETFGNFTIGSSSTVQTSGTSDNLNITGTWTNNGTFAQQTGTVTFSGSTGQVIAGSSKTTFNNLTILSSATVTLSTSADLVDSLTLTSGMFITGGQDFTLISNSSKTARIARITGGDITGTIIVERYINAGQVGWHFLGAPVSSSSVGDWDQEMILSGVGGLNGNACCPIWRSVRRYEESVSVFRNRSYSA